MMEFIYGFFTGLVVVLIGLSFYIRYIGIQLREPEKREEEEPRWI